MSKHTQELICLKEINKKFWKAIKKEKKIYNKNHKKGA